MSHIHSSSCMQGHLKMLSTRCGAEEIMCGIMKFKNPMFAKSREYENMLAISGKILNFSPFKIAFWVILQHTCIIFTHSVPNAAGNYKLRILMHAGIK